MRTSNDIKLLVDCGGSGVKIRRYAQGDLCPESYRVSPKTFEEFCKCLEDMARDGNPAAHPRMTGIAISICGDYDYVNETVERCWAYPFLTGELKDELKNRFRCKKVYVANDGDAHALALKSVYAYAKKGLHLGSAVNLSLGTSVGFGILDGKGELLHAPSGHNWEVGDWPCDTRASNKALYWALGSQGLKELEEQHGKSPSAYITYGKRLCHFFGRDLAPVFHPKIIGLSGGIVAAHFKDIEEGIRRECEERHYRASGGPLEGVDIYLSPEQDSVMRGLADLVDRDHFMPSLLRIAKRFLGAGNPSL